jgi:hypothetical protein
LLIFYFPCVSELKFIRGIVVFYLDNACTTQESAVSVDNPDPTNDMRSNSNFSGTEEQEVPAEIPSVPARSSTPLRRVLDRTALWNQRNQQQAYQYNVYDRVQRVFNAWDNGQPEYGTLQQMVQDLSEISSMGEPAENIPADEFVSPDNAASSSLPDISMSSVPPGMQPEEEPVSIDGPVVDAGTILDAETQHQLHSMLEELTGSSSNERESNLSELAGMLNDIEHAAEVRLPGNLLVPVCVYLSS